MSQEGTAMGIIDYDLLEARMSDLRANPKLDEDVIDDLQARLNDMYDRYTNKSTHSDLIEKDAEAYAMYLALVNQHSSSHAPVFTKLWDVGHLMEAIKPRVALAGRVQYVLRSQIKYPDVINPVNGILCVTPPEVVVRAPREKKIREEGPAKQTVEFDAETQQNEEARTINEIKLALKDYYLRRDRTPVPLYAFALNRHSFSQTVENIFYLSFLVRDKYAAIEEHQGNAVIRPLFIDPRNRDENGPREGSNDSDNEADPYIVEGLDRSDYQDPGLKTSRQSYVSQMTFDLWVELRKVYEHEPIIPSRRQTDESTYTQLPSA